MKKTLEIAFVYVGAIIGAGFASGQEITSFFLGRGSWGIVGILISGILLCVFPAMVFSFCYGKNIHDVDKYMYLAYGKYLCSFAKIFTEIFLFCTFFVMAAGSGALFTECFSLPKDVGIFALLIICLVILLFDLKGIVGISFVLTPIMIGGIFIIGLTFLLFETTPTFAIKGTARAVVNSPIFTALVYTGYNMITIPVLFISLKKGFDKKSAIRGVIFGGALLLICSIFMYLLLYTNYINILPYEIPFLYFAKSKASLYLYFIVLMCAMITTAAASGFSLLNSVSVKFGINKKIIAFFICIIALPCSYMGFSALVSELYGFFGIISLVFLGVFIRNYTKKQAITTHMEKQRSILNK